MSARSDERRRHRAREQELLRVLGMPRADVPHAVQHVLHGEDAIAGDEILDRPAGAAGAL